MPSHGGYISLLAGSGHPRSRRSKGVAHHAVYRTTGSKGPASRLPGSTMEWMNVDDGASIGQIGSESGVITRDAKHPLGARITLERAGSIAPYLITCGIYGCMAHTRFFSTEQEATQAFDLMAVALDSILQASEDDKGLSDAVGQFVERFP